MPRVLLLCLLLSGAWPGSAWSAPWTAVLRVASPQDEARVGRLQGQLSDLPVQLRVSPGPALGPATPEVWAAAVALAEREGAQAVIWFHPEPGALVLHVAEPSSRRLLVRRVQEGPTRGRRGQSARDEAAALIVRSALRALVEGDPVGEEIAPPPPPPPPPEPPPPPAPAPLPAPEPAAPPPPPPARSTWAVGVGWQAVLDGQSPWGQQGPRLSLDWEGARVRVRALLQASLPARLEDAYTRVSLSRHALGVAVDGALVSTARWRLAAGVGLGVAGFLRTTEPRAAGVEAAPARLVPAPFLSPEVLARWRGPRLALEASFAVDALAGAPVLGYQREGVFLVRNPLWSVQPRFGLGLAWTMP
jgi:hypothetical protein